MAEEKIKQKILPTAVLSIWQALLDKKTLDESNLSVETNCTDIVLSVHIPWMISHNLIWKRQNPGEPTKLILTRDSFELIYSLMRMHVEEMISLD